MSGVPVTSIIWTVDQSGRIVCPQSVWAAYTGQSWDDCRDLAWIDAFHPDDRDQLTGLWDAARTAQIHCCWEGRLLHGASATYRHVEGSFGPHPGGGVPSLEWIMACRDVEERKRLDATLRESQQRFHALVDSGPIAIFSCDREGVIQDYNRQAATLWGREPKRGDADEKFCGSLRLYLRDGTLLPHSESPIVRVLRSGASFKDVEVFIERPDGSRIAVVVTFAPLKSESGEVTGAITSFYDVTERKRSEDALRASQARFEAVLDAAPMGVYLVDAKMRIRQVNPKARPVFGEIEPLIGSDFDDAMHILWPLEIAEQVVGLFRNTLETGEPFFHPEFSAERHDSGVREFYDWQIHRITLPNGEYGVVCYFSDISTHVLARQALAKSENQMEAAAQSLRESSDRFALLLNSSAEGIYGMGLSSDCIFLNDAGASMLGYDPAELIGRPIHDVIHHHRADGMPYPLSECKIAKATREAAKIRVDDEVFWHKNGTPVPVAYSVNPMIVGDRNQGAVITFSDISDRQRSELALRTSEEKVRLAARAAQLGIWTWFVTDDRVAWENDRMYEIVGVTPTDKPISATQFATELLHPEDAPRFKEALSLAMESGVRFFFEGRFYRVADKSLRWIEFTGLLQTASGAHSQRLLGTAADITDRKHHEETIRTYAAEISAADHRKTEFLATLAHELRNPLAPLRNGLHLLASRAGDKELLDRTRAMMERQVNQLVRLVDDLLDMARVTSGKIDLQKAPARLQDVIGLAVETSMPLIQSQKHELIINLPASSIIVEVDSTRISQVVSNLLNNAAKYTSSGGRIILTAATSAEGNAMITVEDNGIGIPAEVLGSVFQMFSQVTRSLDHSQGGLGIGLALVHRLVELHGGTVQVESPGPGLGSKFTVTLPTGGS